MATTSGVQVLMLGLAVIGQEPKRKRYGWRENGRNEEIVGSGPLAIGKGVPALLRLNARRGNNWG